MGRVQRALTSLVAAIPAGFLCFLLVQVLMNQADSLKGMTQILVIGTLVFAAFIAVMPFGILIFGGKKKVAEPADAATGADAESGEVDVENASSGEVDLASDEIEEASSDDALADSSAFDLDDSDADVMADSDEESFDDFEIEDEDEKPKKGGKKKR